MDAFQPYNFCTGSLGVLDNDGFASDLHAWDAGGLSLGPDATHFGFVFEGSASIKCDAGDFPVYEGMYFSAPGQLDLEGEGRGIVISAAGYQGFFQMGGPIERAGRLKYIDGCTDSLLIPPILMGDPCLNLLYFPAGIRQTQHTHPSNRIGMIVRGTGKCITPQGTIPLFPGQIFLIRADGLHSFETTTSDMTVIAYHPDSDFGATHENHPMINRTIVNGVSASQLADIRTK